MGHKQTVWETPCDSLLSNSTEFFPLISGDLDHSSWWFLRVKSELQHISRLLQLGTMSCDHSNLHIAPFPAWETTLRILGQLQSNSNLHPWNCPVSLAMHKYM